MTACGSFPSTDADSASQIYVSHASGPHFPVRGLLLQVRLKEVPVNFDRRWNAGRITAIFSELVVGEMYRAAGQLVVDTLLHPQIPEHVKVQVVQQILYWMHSHLSIEMISIEEAIIHAATQYVVFLESGRGEYRNFLRTAKTEQEMADLPPDLPPAERQAQEGFFESISRLCHDEGGHRLTDSIRNQKSNLLAISHEWWPTRFDDPKGPAPETN